MNNPPVGWFPINTAPKDATVLQLLVRVADLPNCMDAEEGEEYSRSIGHNAADDTGEDVWQLVGWSWTQDCYTDVYPTTIIPVAWCHLAALPRGLPL